MNAIPAGLSREGDAAKPVGASQYASAILNILEDASHEATRLAEAQRAVLNIVDDFTVERDRIAAAQRAVLNVLEDATDERVRLGETQKAILNILDDASSEQARLAETQRAVLNILEDIEEEKQRTVQANLDLHAEIAERERAEAALLQANAAAEAANRELEAFSYSVAHDLRAPLRSIDGFSEALLDDHADALDDQARTYLGHVRDSAQHMARLINDLLALSRVSRADLKRGPIDLGDIARTIFTRYQRAEPDRIAQLVAPPTVEAVGDAALAGVLLDNLLGNAWKFSRKHPVANIELGTQREGGETVYFVRDDGAGFDMAYADKLFAVFQRLHSVGEFDGTGIGLATAQRVVRRHGGRIWAEGAVEQGATFYFTLGDQR